MNILDSASATEKELVRRIVDNYRGGYENIKADKHSIIDSPGCWLHSLFYDFNLSGSSCCINFSNKDDQLLATYVLPKGNDASEFFQHINIKKASFFEQIAFLKLLSKNNLIFFEKNYDCGLTKFSKHSDHDVDKWEKHGLRYYDEIIKNKDIFDFLNTYYWSCVIPSSILCDYKDNGFKTIEAQRHRENAILTRVGILSAFLIALFSPWLMTKYSKTSIDSYQLDKILNAIPKQVDEIKLNKEQMDSVITIINKIAQPHNGKTNNEKP